MKYAYAYLLSINNIDFDRLQKIQDFRNYLNINRDIYSVLNSRFIAAEKKYLILNALCKEMCLEHDFYCLTKVIIDRRRVSLIYQIVEQIIVMCSAKLGYKYVTISTIRNISEDSMSRFKTQIENKLRCKVIMHHNVDPSLIGGAVINIDYKIIDTSLRSRKIKFANIMSDYLRDQDLLSLA